VAFLPAEIIKKKRNNHSLTYEEIKFLIDGFTRGEIPDYQMSAFMMSVYFKGMTAEETAALTKCVLHSGTTVDLSHVKKFKVDKHSTGGVGDKTTLILGPIVASLGIPVPSIAGRGLGHTGGTLDKLESIPGFNINLSLEDFVTHIEKHGICFIGQTSEICPADKKMYALRDVTATVESLPLICASIMSKKLSEGIDGLVLDVKFGSGAFMKAPHDAEVLAKALIDTAKAYGKKISALLTNMEQPLGRFAGNSLEIEECLAILKGDKKIAPDTRELSLWLSAEMIHLAGVGKDEKETYAICERQLENGQAYEKFLELCKAQGGNLEKLPKAKHQHHVVAEADGFISGFHTEKIGLGGIIIKAGREKITDTLDYTAGIEFHKKIGDSVKRGEKIFTVHGDHEDHLLKGCHWLKSTFTISLQKPERPSLILKTLR
jgi:pyrimidine-nucleoside phosphorylase